MTRLQRLGLLSFLIVVLMLLAAMAEAMGAWLPLASRIILVALVTLGAAALMLEKKR